jgi:hypothetical protein
MFEIHITGLEHPNPHHGAARATAKGVWGHSLGAIQVKCRGPKGYRDKPKIQSRRQARSLLMHAVLVNHACGFVGVMSHTSCTMPLTAIWHGCFTGFIRTVRKMFQVLTGRVWQPSYGCCWAVNMVTAYSPSLSGPLLSAQQDRVLLSTGDYIYDTRCNMWSTCANVNHVYKVAFILYLLACGHAIMIPHWTRFCNEVQCKMIFKVVHHTSESVHCALSISCCNYYLIWRKCLVLWQVLNASVRNHGLVDVGVLQIFIIDAEQTRFARRHDSGIWHKRLMLVYTLSIMSTKPWEKAEMFLRWWEYDKEFCGVTGHLSHLKFLTNKQCPPKTPNPWYKPNMVVHRCTYLLNEMKNIYV